MPKSKIHTLAIVHPKAMLAPDVEVGPASSIGKGVTIGSGTTIAANVFITGETKIGKNNKIFSGAVIGTEPQDLKFHGEKTFLEIGDNNTIREYVTIHRGSASGIGKTTIGNNCFLMVSSHIAHDCHIGNSVGMTNLTSLGGHVTIGDEAWIGGMVGIHHFVTVGKLAFIGGYSKVVKDVPPFMLADGRPTKIRGLNIVGLKRAEFSAAQISILKKAYQLLYRSKLNISQALERIECEVEKTPEIAELIRSIKDTPNGRMGRSRK